MRYLPKWSAGLGMEVSVREDGRLLENYTALVAPKILDIGQTRELLASEQAIDWVLINPEDEIAADPIAGLRELLAIGFFGPDDPLVDARGTSTSPAASQKSELLTIALQDLPTDWRAYQRYDVVVAGTATLEQLAKQTAAIQTLRSWVLNGGTIVIYDAENPEPALDTLNFRWTTTRTPRR